MCGHRAAGLHEVRRPHGSVANRVDGIRTQCAVGAARVEAFLGIDNLTNQSTVSSVIVNQASKQYFEPGLPRNWVVGLTSQIPL